MKLLGFEGIVHYYMSIKYICKSIEIGQVQCDQ